MKIVLSRKGFDDENGEFASPILPNNMMISLPIPSRGDKTKYQDLILNYKKYKTYYDLMRNLGIKTIAKRTECHLDPDIRKESLKRQKGWKTAFGQENGSQTHLQRQNVGVGDIFLFFGTFKKTKWEKNKLVFDTNFPEKHIIFGYLKIDYIKHKKEDFPHWLENHPHYSRRTKKNTIYIGKEGGIFKFNNKFILTKEGEPKSHWGLPPFFKNAKISYHSKKSWKKHYFQSTSRGQEFVIKDNLKVENWAKNLIKKK